MQHYLLIYEAIDDFMQRRAEFRTAHLNLLKEYEKKGKLVLAGALGEKGSAMLFLSDSPKIVEDFAKKDPYVLNGLIIKYNVFSWVTVIGKDAQNKI